MKKISQSTIHGKCMPDYETFSYVCCKKEVDIISRLMYIPYIDRNAGIIRNFIFTLKLNRLKLDYEKF